MHNRILRRVASVVVAPVLVVSAAQADPRGAYIAALVVSASAQRDVHSAEAAYAAARQQRIQAEATLRAATAAETAPLAGRVEALRRRPAVEVDTSRSAGLAAQVETLRRRPEIRPIQVLPNPRIAGIDTELADQARRLADLEQERRRQASARAASERDAERATATVDRSARDLDHARARTEGASALLRRLDAPDPELLALLQAEARPRASRALEGRPMDALVIALQRLRNSAAAIRAESTERGAARFSDVPAGRSVFMGGGIVEQVMATDPVSIDQIALPTLMISKSGDYMLSRQDRDSLPILARMAEGRMAVGAGDYDTCLLRGLAGTSGDVAARAVIGACRSLHPASARHDIVLRFEEPLRLDEAYLLVGPAIETLADALQRFSAEAMQVHAEAMASIVAEARQQAQGRLESRQREVAAIEQRLQRERADQSGAQAALAAARAAEFEAERLRDAFQVTVSDAALRKERAALEAAARAEAEVSATVAAVENARMAAELVSAQRALATALEVAAAAAAGANALQATELATAQRALATATEARRQADAQRLRPLVESEAEAQQHLARATAAATSEAASAASSKRAAFLAHLSRETLERQFKGSARLDLRYGSSGNMCITFGNAGRFAIANPGFDLLFRGKPIQELGIKPTDFIPLFDQYGRVAFSYDNQYGEPVQGLRAGSSSAPDCNFVMRVDGDHGRIFERVGGAISSWRDPSNWSVRVSGQLSLPGDVQEWGEAYASQRRWRHMPTPSERLFAAEIAAVEAEARAQIETAAATRGDAVAGTRVVSPASAPVTAATMPEAADPARQEAALALDASRIRNIQQRLTALGYDTRGADGKLGASSRAAIARFQRATGIPDSGFLGPVDLARLGIPSGPGDLANR